MNIQQLRQSLKLKWLSYFKQNRPWLVKMRVWGTYDGVRRPSSGFILATLSVLEPEFEQMLTFMMELNNNPDAIVTALGLNFNPDEELRSLNAENSPATSPVPKESLEEKLVVEKSLPVPAVAVATEIVSHSPAKAQYLEKMPSDVPIAHKPLPAFAIATKVTLQSSSRIPHSPKPASGMLRQKSLALTTTVPSNGKNMPSLAFAVAVPSNNGESVPRQVVVEQQTSLAIATESLSQAKMSSSIAVTAEVPSNSQQVKIQPQDSPRQVKRFPHTNARSLASWVDEFCQGKA